MATEGPRYPGTAASLANAGSSENAEAWVTPGNAGADDGTETVITAPTYDSPDISELLVCSNFGFTTIPDAATILGITVEIDRRNSAGAASDNRVQLATGTTFAALVGTNKADTALDWPTATAVATYGGAADTWTAGLTVAQLKATGFAVFLSAQADAANTDVQVDYVRVTVEYSAPIERTWTESVSTSDVWTRTGTFLRAMAEAVTTGDVWTRVLAAVRSWSEAISTSDVWAQIKITMRAMAEAVSTSDVWTRAGTFGRTLTETATTSDVWTRVVTLARDWTEAVSTADAWARLATLARSWSEAITTSDVWVAIKQGAGTIERGWSEAVATSDAWAGVVRLVGGIRPLIDSIIHPKPRDR
jgi:hypothetical protein